jgi:hypothetical protein
MSGGDSILASREGQVALVKATAVNPDWDQTKWNQILFENANKNHLH